MALQTNLIDASHFGRIAICYHEWRHVLNDLGATSDNRIAPDSAKLMNSGKPANDGMIFYSHMARNSSVVRENNVIADSAIMGDMRVGKEVAMRTDDGLRSWKGTSVDRTKLTKRIVVANLEIGRLGCVLQILRTLPDRGVRIKNILLSDARGASDGYMTD